MSEALQTLRYAIKVLDDELEQDLKNRRHRLRMGISTVDYENGKEVGIERSIKALRSLETIETLKSAAHDDEQWLEDL